MMQYEGMKKGSLGCRVVINNYLMNDFEADDYHLWRIKLELAKEGSTQAIEEIKAQIGAHADSQHRFMQANMAQVCIITCSFSMVRPFICSTRTKFTPPIRHANQFLASYYSWVLFVRLRQGQTSMRECLGRQRHSLPGLKRRHPIVRHTLAPLKIWLIKGFPANSVLDRVRREIHPHRIVPKISIIANS